jgi:hypothetical protein
VDDGSAVIAVHHMFKQSASTPVSKDKVRPSRKGKERQVDCGIPSEYLLPPPPPLVSGEKRKRTPRAPVNVANVFEIGQLVSIVGRVELWIDRRERIVFVDNVIRNIDATTLDAAGQEGFILSIEDCNEEPKHMLQALNLAATEYSKPYQLPNLIPKETADFVPGKLREITSSASGPSGAHEAQLRGRYAPRPMHYEEDGAQIRALRISEEPRRSLRVMEDVSDLANNGAWRKRTLGMTRRPMPEASVKRDNTTMLTEEAVRVIKVDAERDSIDPPSSLLSIASNSTISTPRKRQLRHYTKLSDSKMTDSTFRVYVEKHVVDHCSDNTNGAAFSSPNATPRASSRRGANRQMSAHIGPPAFTLNYLMQVEDLRGHAQRTVDVLTRRREEKKKRKAATSTSASKIVISTEKSVDKMKRLYSSVIQAMMLDGIIVLALPSVKIKSSYNEKRQCRGDQSLDLDQVYRKAAIQEDAYQVVTSSLLADPILDILSRSNTIKNSLNSAQIVEKMQATDERWRYIRPENVQECMRLLFPNRHQEEV